MKISQKFIKQEALSIINAALDRYDEYYIDHIAGDLGLEDDEEKLSIIADKVSAEIKRILKKGKR